MSNSIFNTNPLKESESLELEQRLLTSVNIQFDYYPITCRDIQKTPNAIHSIYRGNANRPNLILNNNQYFPTFYQSSELAIYSKLHNGTHPAELIIKHTPISGDITPIYVCFFINSLTENSNNPSTPHQSSLNKSINALIQFTDPLDIDISPLLSSYIFTNNTKKEIQITWQIYQTVNNNGKCMVVLIDNPLYLDAELINQIPQNKTPPFKIINTFIKSNQTIETFEIVGKNAVALTTGSNNNEMTCDMIPDTEYGDINVVQMPIQVGKNETDRLYILNIIVYICVSVAILAVEIYGSWLIFDTVLDKYVITKSNDNNVKAIANDNKEKIILCLVAWFVIFVVVTVLFLWFGLLSKPPNTILTSMGVFFAVSAVITTLGINVLSKYVKELNLFSTLT